MELAYLHSIFPKLTATFIYREVLELQRRGIPIKNYSIHKPKPSDLSNESIVLCDDTVYLLPISLFTFLRCHTIFFLRSPFVYIKALIKMLTGTTRNLRDKYRSLLHFGEGVVLADKMSRDGIQHIHAHYASQTASVARVIYLLTNIPYSFTGHAHDIWHDKLLLPEKLEEAIFIICCSEFGRQYLLKQSKRDVSNKVHLIYHGVDSRIFIPPMNDAKRKRNFILSIGRLTEQKGYPDLIKACKILHDRNINITCNIVGEGEQRSLLEQLIKDYKLQDQVKLLGAIKQENIMEYYHNAWIFVLPCIDTHEGNRDGLPNVLMEAMATGLPVITTANSAQSELITHEKQGLLVAQSSPLEIAKAIEKLIIDHNLWGKIQFHARQRMENDFDCRKTIEPLLDLLENCGDR